MTAQEKMDAKLSAQSTEMLIEISLQLADKTDEYSMIVASNVDRHLMDRMDEKEFCDHMAKVEAILDAAL